MILKEGDDYQVVPGSEIVIARTAHRNNSSNYYVNSKKSSFTEVTELLKKYGVDLDNNRFLILQVGPLSLEFMESEKVFDPKEVYGDAPNPTKL